MAVVVCVALGAAASGVQAWDELAPPNWRGGGPGTTNRVGGINVDEFSGESTHLGRFTGEGFHILTIEDLTFVGAATWTAANGDTLDVEFTGQLFPSGDPVYLYGFIADLVVVGGTGRLAHAEGEAVMTGGFDGQQPGEFYFDVEGTLHPRGK